MASRKNGIIETTSADDILALIYAFDQTHQIMSDLKGAK
jgi:hypothetical protein